MPSRVESHEIRGRLSKHPGDISQPNASAERKKCPPYFVNALYSRSSLIEHYERSAMKNKCTSTYLARRGFDIASSPPIIDRTDNLAHSEY